ncbi:MAG: PaaI family thioesterase [Actinocatenispora sp.]
MNRLDANSIPGIGPLGPAVERTGIDIDVAGPDRVVGRMPVAGNTQSYGMLHGGVSCVLAETLGTMGAALHAGPDRRAVGIEINATHHRSVRDGVVTGTATALHRGRSVASYRIVITDEDDRLVCTARLTCLIRDVGDASHQTGTESPSAGRPDDGGPITG